MENLGTYPDYKNATLPSDLDGPDNIWDYGFASGNSSRSIVKYKIILQNHKSKKKDLKESQSVTTE